MKPSKLYIEDFICYECAFIDFTEFSAALIVGRKENNDTLSNGVGKTTIFKAIEYVLFNQSDSPLERLIRDDTNACQVVLDFFIGDQEYRLARSRTKKGSTDLTLLERNTVPGTVEEVYHSVKNGWESPWLGKKLTEKFWKDKSGSRAGDTEKDLAKLIKINHKSFLSTALFPQNDMAGLPTATPEKRKGILKDALNLLVYTKLEKIAKDKSSILTKDVDKTQILIDALGDPDKDLSDLNAQMIITEQSLVIKNAELIQVNAEQEVFNNKINDLKNIHTNLESKFASLLSQEKIFISEKNKLETSVKEYQSKRANVSKSARELVLEIKDLKELQSKLIEIDYSQVDILGEEITKIKDQIAHHNVNIKNCIEKNEELKIPMPNDATCKHCRQPMTDKHRKECKEQIAKDMMAFQESVKQSKAAINISSAEIIKHQQTINSINLSKQQLEGINTKISAKNKEVQDKKILHDEYSALLDKFTNELANKIKELELIQIELNNSSLEEAKVIEQQIIEEKAKITTLQPILLQLNKEINHYNSNKAVIQHTMGQKDKDKIKKEVLKKTLLDLEEKFNMYPLVIQAFSSTGIPNLIIQNVLDDLQIEANILLSQLKPGLQLSFFIEKTKGDGSQADTLDINYHINGKDRYYEQLSGAMKLAVSFSLKLGLSFLLQKMIGTDIKFLLLDEIDQALDKASVDAFADIVKFFQKEFNILIITHNDRLKDKFSHAILVEQDINMVSKARVVSSW
jgi:DNA repair exonuclease SbcCD ATPase subunit